MIWGNAGMLGAIQQEQIPRIIGFQPIALVNSATSTTVVSSNTVVVSVPTGTTNGQLMIALIEMVTSLSGTLNTPIGWTQIDIAPSSTNQNVLFYRVASSEPASYTFQSSSANATSVSGIIITLSNTSTITPIDQHSTAVANESTHTTPAITPTNNNSLILGAFAENVALPLTFVLPSVQYAQAGVTATSAVGGAVQTTATSQSVTATTTSSVTIRKYAVSINHV